MPITATNPFKGRQYPGEVILQAVRWHLRYPLAYLHVSEILAERGLFIDASCIWRWVQAYAPELDKRCRPHLKATNKSYRVDETYIKVKGKDRYLYRAVDSTGQTVDFLLTARRDAEAAKRFFRKVFSAEGNPVPRVLNVDGNPAYPGSGSGIESRRNGAAPCSFPAPSREEAGPTGERIRLISECVADTTGHRNYAHDQQGASTLAAQA